MAAVTIPEIRTLDPYYEKVVLLLSANGANGSTAFSDNSLFKRPVTPVGNAQISTAQSKFGGASALFNGAGSFIKVPNGPHFALGSVCTVEASVYPTAFTKPVAQVVGAHRYGINNQFILYIDSSGRPHFLVSDGTDVPSASAVSLNAWTHIAICLESGVLRMFLNGALVKSVAYSTPIRAFNDDLTCGADITANTNSFFTGYQ